MHSNFFLLAPLSSSSLSSLLTSNRGGISVSVVSISVASDAVSSVYLSGEVVCCFFCASVFHGARFCCVSLLLHFLCLCWFASWVILSSSYGFMQFLWCHSELLSNLGLQYSCFKCGFSQKEMDSSSYTSGGVLFINLSYVRVEWLW